MKLKPGIELLDEIEGVGREAINSDLVEIKLNGWLNQGQPIQKDFVTSITLGSRNVIPGIEYAIIGMKKQGQRKVKISPHLAYRETGIKELIPPNALLIYQIEVLDIKSNS